METCPVRNFNIPLAFILFAATVCMAWWFRWRTADLAWGMWISSLVLGYSFILVSIAGGLFRNSAERTVREGISRPIRDPVTPFHKNGTYGMVLAVIILLMAGLSIAALVFFVVAGICGAIATIPGILEKRGRPLRSRCLVAAARILSRFPTALFFLAVFSVHFLGFHFVHGMFLNAFFPRVNPSGLFNSMEDGFYLYRTLLSDLLTHYAPFILAGAVSQLPEYKKAYWTRGPSMMFRPYANVVRMHILIILFGFLSAFGLEGGMLNLLLALYFFPLSDLLRLRREKPEKRIRGPHRPS